jgi:hypothetical protein
VRWSEGHFVGIRVGEVVELFDGGVAFCYVSIYDLREQAGEVWFAVVPLPGDDDDRSVSGNPSPAPTIVDASSDAEMSPTVFDVSSGTEEDRVGGARWADITSSDEDSQDEAAGDSDVSDRRDEAVRDFGRRLFNATDDDPDGVYEMLPPRPRRRGGVGRRRPPLRSVWDAMEETVRRFCERGDSAARRDLAIELNSRALCLCLAFRVLGFEVYIPGDLRGPLSALLDGNELLAPHRARIHHVAVTGSFVYCQHGAYVVWLREHFAPVRLRRSGWLSLPRGARLFHVTCGRDALALDNLIMTLPVLLAQRAQVREYLGELAGRVMYAQLMGRDDVAFGFMDTLVAMIHWEDVIVARIRELRGFTLDVVGGRRLAAPW